MSELNLRIDEVRCQGHALCYMLAPDLFDVDEAGRGSVKVEALTPVLVEHAEVAASRCPEQAVVLQS